MTFHAAGAKQTLSEREQELLKWEYFCYGAQIIPYIWCLLSYKKKVGAKLKGIPNGFRIPNPEISYLDL
jgi:hypothetical protein